MSFHVGGSSGSSQQTTSQTDQIDPRILEPWLSFEDQAHDTAQLPYQPYDPSARVAPLNSYQTAGIDALKALGTGNLGQDQLQGAIDRTTSLTQPRQLSGDPSIMAGAFTSGAPQLGPTALFSGAQLGPAALFGGANPGQAATFGGAGVDMGSIPQVGAPQIGGVPAYGGAQLNFGAVPQVNPGSIAGSLYQPGGAQVGPVATYGGATADMRSAPSVSAPSLGRAALGHAGMQGGVNLDPAALIHGAPQTSAAQIDLGQLGQVSAPGISGLLSHPGAAQTNLQALGGLGAGTAAQGMSAYQNPYQDQVIQAAMGDLGQAHDRVLNQNNSDATMTGGEGAAFGSRAGVERALSDQSYYKQVADMTAGLRAQGFDTALGAGQSDADRALQAASQQYGTTADILGQNTAARNTALQNAASRGLSGLQSDQSSALQAGLSNAQLRSNALGVNAGYLQGQRQFDATNAMDVLTGNANALNARNLAQGQLNYQVGSGNAQRATDASLQNAAQANALTTAQGQMSLDASKSTASNQLGLLLQSLQNQQQAGLFSAGAQNAASMANAGYAQDAAQAAAQRYAQALAGDQSANLQSGLNFQNILGNLVGQQGALSNQAGIAGMNFLGQQATSQANLNLQAGQSNQNALLQALMGNAANQQQAGLANQAAQNNFALTGSGYQQQAGMAGMDALNQFGLAQGGYNQAAELANAGALNTTNSQQGQMDLSSMLANLGYINNASQFNAGQALTAGQTDASNQLASNSQQLQAGQQLAGYGQTARDWASAGANDLLNAGSIVQGNQQQLADATYDQFLRQVGYPTEQLKNYAIPFGMYPSTSQGGTTTGSSTSNSRSKSSGAGLGG